MSSLWNTGHRSPGYTKDLSRRMLRRRGEYTKRLLRHESRQNRFFMKKIALIERQSEQLNRFFPTKIKQLFLISVRACLLGQLLISIKTQPLVSYFDLPSIASTRQ